MKKVRLFLMLLMVAMLPLAMQAQQALPYSYGFEDNDLTADGWTLSDCHSNTGITTSSKMNGDYGFSFHWSTTPPQYLISPELTGTTSGVDVSFYYKKGGSYTETFMVGYSTTDASSSSFTWGEEITASSDWTLYNDFFPAGTKYIAIAYTANDKYYLYLDDFTFAAPATCAKPTAVTVADITTTSATISWTENNTTTPQGWIILLNDEEVEADSNPFPLNTLTSNTAYTVQVKALCSDTDESEYSAEISFRTLCDVVTIDEENIYTEDFEEYEASSFPDCWTRDVAYTSYPYVIANSSYTTYSHNGTKAMYMYFYGSANSNVISTPSFTNDINTLQVSFFARYSSTNPILEVGVMDQTTFEPVDTIVLTSTYPTNAFTVMFNHYTGNGNRIAFRITPSGTSSYTNYYTYLDDVTVELIPSCIAPSNVTVIDSTITTTTATVAWTDRNETDPENGWIINLNGIDTIVTENPFTFDDLTSATTYTVKVAAFCSETDTSDWSATANFITPCETVVVTDQEPYTEGFETEELICWTNDIISGSLEWEITDDVAEVGNQSVSFGGTYSSSGSAYLVSPVFDLTQITTEPQLSFYHQQAEYDDWHDTYNEELHVYYRTSPTDTWTLLADYTSNYEEFTLETMTLPNPTATYQIAFKGVEHNGYGVQLDEIVVEATPTCPKPTDLTASSITTTSAEIGWTVGGEETEWTVEVDGVDTIVTTNPITLTNLTPSTTYTIRVKANCSADDQSQWSNELSFTTACDAITITDQFSEDFSGYTATNYDALGVMPTCWDAIAAATYGPHVYAGSYGPNGTNDNALIFTSGTSLNYGSPNLAVLPEFTNDLQGYTLSFKAKLESSYAPGVLTYGYITGVDQTTFTVIDTVAASTTAQAFAYTLPSIPAGTRLAFCYSNSNIYYCCGIDDVVIAFIEEDTCATPSDVAVNNNVVTWTGDAASYNVTITANGETTTENVTGNSYTVTGLEDSTLVTVSVQAVCDEDNLSDWSEAVEFTYIATGINNYNLTANVFPNPTTGNVTIVLSHPMVNANVQVCDIYGRQISTHQVEGLQFELNLGNLAPGVYMLRFIEANAVLNTVKVVKR